MKYLALIVFFILAIDVGISAPKKGPPISVNVDLSATSATTFLIPSISIAPAAAIDPGTFSVNLFPDMAASHPYLSIFVTQTQDGSATRNCPSAICGTSNTIGGNECSARMIDLYDFNRSENSSAEKHSMVRQTFTYTMQTRYALASIKFS